MGVPQEIEQQTVGRKPTRKRSVPVAKTTVARPVEIEQVHEEPAPPVEAEAAATDKELAMQARMKMKQRMDKLAMMFSVAEDNAAAEPTDDDHVIEDKGD